MMTNKLNFLESLNTLHADAIYIIRTSINPIIVKKEPGTDSLFPICTLERFVLHAQIRNKELVPGFRFPVPDQ